MTTIVTQPDSKSYAIYSNNRKIVECNDPETTYNELVKNLGVDTSNVQIIEMDYFPDTLGNISNIAYIEGSAVLTKNNNIDNIIDQINADMQAPNLGKHKSRTNTTVDNSQTVETSQQTTEDTINMNVPVGNVETPKLGDLIYVTGLDGILRKITGGIGTVHLVYNSNKDIENLDDESNEATVSNKNILVELEEIPGTYFSWSEIKDKQLELKAKYGYKPVCVIR